MHHQRVGLIPGVQPRHTSQKPLPEGGKELSWQLLGVFGDRRARSRPPVGWVILRASWLFLMEEQFITNKISIDWAVTRGNCLSHEGEKLDPLLAPLHAYSHTFVFGAAGAWAGWDCHHGSRSAPSNPPCLWECSFEQIFSVFSTLYLALGAASLNLCSQLCSQGSHPSIFFYLSKTEQLFCPGP